MAPATFLLVALALVAATLARSPFPHEDNIAGAASTTNDIVMFNDSPYRLPNTTSPISYSLRLAPDFETFGYASTVSIQVVANGPGVSTIVLNSVGLTIITTTVVLNNVNIWANTATDEYNMLYLNLNTELLYTPDNPTVYTITIAFNGLLRTDMYGFYRSWYTTGNEIRWMATTQFQATSARAAFPCYDEPSYKATFDIVIERDATYRSWSNMRLQSSVLLNNGRFEDTFHRTPIMSTYLLAFIVAEYTTLEVTNNQGLLTYEVIARPDAISNGQGTYALEVGQQLLAAMDAITGIPFAGMDPNIKMTQASIPDFSAGAMENWGLLTYREAYLMYDPAHTNSRFQERIAYILSHEIAHMWFGNLVTCEWWDDLWLNEGFARYYQYFLTHEVETDMGFETRFVTEQVHSSLLSDSALTAHPLSDPSVDSPASVSSHFSTITYNKGAAVIRMTEHLLGSGVHQQGLHNYLVDRSYNTAVPSDLFSALDDVAASSGAIAQYGTGFTVDEYYRSWTEKAGHPLLYVSVDHATGEMVIEQRRFDINTGYSSVSSNWIIPITFTSAHNPDFTNTKPTLIIRDTITVTNRGSIGNDWVIFNIQQTGFYRVNYDDYTWALITLALRGEDRTLIHEYNKAQIVDDLFQLARSGLLSYTRAFNILSFLEFETDYAPWIAAINGLNWLRRRFAGTAQLATFEDQIATWATPLMSTLTYYPIPGELWMRSYLRWQMATMLCGINVPACRAAATAQFVNLRDNNIEVPNDSRSWVYCNALRDGTEADFTFLWNRFQNHPVYTEKILLLENLGCTPHAASLNTLLTGITTPNNVVRQQDYTTAFNAAVVGNEQNTQTVFTWVQNNFALVAGAFSNVSTPLSYISNRLLNEAEVTQFIAWANTNQAVLGQFHINVVNNAETTRNLITWTTTISADVGSYLENGYQADVTTTEATPPTTDEPTTVLPPDVEAPVVPDDDGGAAAAVASTFLTVGLALAAAVFARG